mgnify:CR=1 FL=1
MTTKVVVPRDPNPTGYYQVAWLGINVDSAKKDDRVSQTPDGWTHPGDPSAP